MNVYVTLDNGERFSFGVDLALDENEKASDKETRLAAKGIIQGKVGVWGYLHPAGVGDGSSIYCFTIIDPAKVTGIYVVAS